MRVSSENIKMLMCCVFWICIHNSITKRPNIKVMSFVILCLHRKSSTSGLFHSDIDNKKLDTIVIAYPLL